MVAQLRAVRQHDHCPVLPDAPNLGAEVPGERDGMGHPGGDRVEVRDRLDTVPAARLAAAAAPARYAATDAGLSR
jgi:hypothetical protein